MSKNTRKKILDAAIQEFSKSGYHQTQMEAIADRAGVAKGTLYYNFPSKAKLFSFAVTSGIDLLLEGAMKGLISDLPFAEHMKQLAETHVRLYLKQSDLSKILNNELSSGLDIEVREDIERSRNRYLRFLEMVLEEGERLGFARKTNKRLTAVATFGMLDSLCNYHIANPDRFTVQQVSDAFYEVLSDGISDRNPPEDTHAGRLRVKK